ncbi:unnamed protein product [Caenorhabditis bovis]|uniref:Uncharacterized protein n=1 Tax=Caenorhabditis bovis TaxID=2654633 RepID=A0A8S1EAD0_9PELO|nr:unnamed protein product [Caenorhabditis bovis]
MERVQIAVKSQPASHQKINHRTCCNLCHIKLGAAFLGFIEAVIAVSVLIGALQQVVWKNDHKLTGSCIDTLFRDCHIFLYKHFDITVYFDYVVIIMMVFIIISIQSMFERMWLATVLLILSGLQSYLFSSVIRCSMYLADIEENRRRRESAFERCSERVRIAKENGLWRTTSWGGGFQQYKGQYDMEKPKKESKSKGFHVQWNTDVETGLKKVEPKIEIIELARTESIDPSITQLSPIPEDEVKNPVPIKTSKISRTSTKHDDRRDSTNSTGSNRVRRSSESPRKDEKKPRYVKKTSSEGASKLEDEVRRMSKDHHQPHVQRISSKEKSSLINEPTRMEHTHRRASLKKNKSVDSGDVYDEVVSFYKDRHHRRR